MESALSNSGFSSLRSALLFLPLHVNRWLTRNAKNSNAVSLSSAGSRERAEALLKIGLRILSGFAEDAWSTPPEGKAFQPLPPIVCQGIRHIRDSVTAAIESDSPEIAERASWAIASIVGKRDVALTSQFLLLAQSCHVVQIGRKLCIENSKSPHDAEVLCMERLWRLRSGRPGTSHLEAAQESVQYLEAHSLAWHLMAWGTPVEQALREITAQGISVLSLSKDPDQRFIYSTFISATAGEPPLISRVPFNEEKWAIVQSTSNEFSELVEDTGECDDLTDASGEIGSCSLKFIAAATDFLAPALSSLSPETRLSHSFTLTFTAF